LAERRGKGLQIPLHRFKSGTHLHNIDGRRPARPQRSDCTVWNDLRMERISWWRSGYTRLAVLASLAALAAFVIAENVPFADPIPAAITAVISVRVAFHQAAKETSFQVLGALLGASIALALVHVVTSGAILILLLVLCAFGIARLVRVAARQEMPFVAANIAVTSIIVLGVNFSTEGALNRFSGVFIGASCALIASFLASPTRDTVMLIEQSAALQRDLGALLSDVADGLRSSPSMDETRVWRNAATDLRNRSLGLEAKFEELRSHRGWSPRIDAEELQTLKFTVEANRIMSVRVLSIAADISNSMVAGTTSLPQAALTPLANLIAMASDNMAADDPTTTVGVTAMSEAVRLADETAQIALIGGIVQNLTRINQASAHAADEAHSHAHGPDNHHNVQPPTGDVKQGDDLDEDAAGIAPSGPS
jgi:hypothetical protein